MAYTTSVPLARLKFADWFNYYGASTELAVTATPDLSVTQITHLETGETLSDGALIPAQPATSFDVPDPRADGWVTPTGSYIRGWPYDVTVTISAAGKPSLLWSGTVRVHRDVEYVTPLMGTMSQAGGADSVATVDAVVKAQNALITYSNLEPSTTSYTTGDGAVYDVAWLPDGIVVSATTPPLDDFADTYTIPTVTGVDYLIGGAVVTPGTYTVAPPSTVTVDALPTAGYALAGPRQWSGSYTLPDVTEDFNVAAGTSYAGKATTTGGLTWTDAQGGEIFLDTTGVTVDGAKATGGGARIDPTVATAHIAVDFVVDPASPHERVGLWILGPAGAGTPSFFIQVRGTTNGSGCTVHAFDAAGTELANTTLTLSTGRVSIVNDGTNINVRVNGSKVLGPFTTPATTNKSVGFGMKHDTVAVTTPARADDFAVDYA